MSPYRIYMGLGTLAVVILAGLSASAQDFEVRGAQLFEPADVRPYGNWAAPRQGFFFDFEGIFWNISAPKKMAIGDPTLTPTVYYGLEDAEAAEWSYSDGDAVTATNGLDTGRFRDKWKQGDRIEFGFINDEHGWLIGTMVLNRQTMHIAAQNVDMVFNDPPFGAEGQTLMSVYGTLTHADGTTEDLFLEQAVTFAEVHVANRLKIQGAEAMYLYRPHQRHYGGTIEWMVGARYLDVRDVFSVDATGGILADSYWNTDARNRIAGPQVAVRAYKPFGRFAISTEARFMAGINWENVRQDGMLGSQLVPLNAEPLPRLMAATGFQHEWHNTEFSPLVELRLDGHVQLTNLIALKAGYTLVWLDNIARASEMVDYTVPSLGITTANGGQREDLFMHGFSIGVELNR